MLLLKILEKDGAFFLLFSLYFTCDFVQYLKISLADIRFLLLWCVTNYLWYSQYKMLNSIFETNLWWYPWCLLQLNNFSLFKNFPNFLNKNLYLICKWQLKITTYLRWNGHKYTHDHLFLPNLTIGEISAEKKWVNINLKPSKQ